MKNGAGTGRIGFAGRYRSSCNGEAIGVSVFGIAFQYDPVQRQRCVLVSKFQFATVANAAMIASLEGMPGSGREVF